MGSLAGKLRHLAAGVRPTSRQEIKKILKDLGFNEEGIRIDRDLHRATERLRKATRIKVITASARHMKGPVILDKYYLACKARRGESPEAKEYCARIAWQIFCSHIAPGYSGCTDFGKGKSYSGPLAIK